MRLENLPTVDEEMLRTLSLEQLREYIRCNVDKMDSQTKMMVDSELGSRVSAIARMWDLLDDIEPDSSGRYGTAINKKSHTYKLRKAAGFTYP